MLWLKKSAGDISIAGTQDPLEGNYLSVPQKGCPTDCVAQPVGPYYARPGVAEATGFVDGKFEYLLGFSSELNAGGLKVD